MTEQGTPEPQMPVKPRRKYVPRTPKTAFGKAVHAVNQLAPMDLLKLEKYVVEYKSTMIAQLRGRE
jgi:hypothetical protein